jgi:hypothetical protein
LNREPKPGENPEPQRALRDDVANRLLGWFWANRFESFEGKTWGYAMIGMWFTQADKTSFDQLCEHQANYEEVKRLRERLANLEGKERAMLDLLEGEE